MNELDEFRTRVLTRQAEAEEAMVLGDPAPRMQMWSRANPVTLFGAWGPCKSGWSELRQIFPWVASRFSEAADFRFDVEVAAVSGDAAYTVGYERFRASIDGGPVEPVTVRVTHIYRREDGEWKIVHRHGDFAPPDQSRALDAALTHPPSVPR